MKYNSPEFSPEVSTLFGFNEKKTNSFSIEQINHNVVES